MKKVLLTLVLAILFTSGVSAKAGEAALIIEKSAPGHEITQLKDEYPEPLPNN